MLHLESFDLEEIASALQNQNRFERQWLINPETGEIAYWTMYHGIDGHDSEDLDELDLLPICPLPSDVWYQDMADFVSQLSDDHACRRLSRAIDGRGAFRRFKNEMHEEFPHLLPAWYAFSDIRAKRRAVQWLAENSLIDDETARRFLAQRPDPDLP